mmetsp:Transcript_6437/g.21333  ORF Transcript_6437/g.21333 Transcript_6437/m.21333 type:complete len:331 (-) Transcript_6437:271-1263(-)
MLALGRVPRSDRLGGPDERPGRRLLCGEVEPLLQRQLVAAAAEGRLEVWQRRGGDGQRLARGGGGVGLQLGRGGQRQVLGRLHEGDVAALDAVHKEGHAGTPRHKPREADAWLVLARALQVGGQARELLEPECATAVDVVLCKHARRLAVIGAQPELLERLADLVHVQPARAVLVERAEGRLHCPVRVQNAQIRGGDRRVLQAAAAVEGARRTAAADCLPKRVCERREVVVQRGGARRVDLDLAVVADVGREVVAGHQRREEPRGVRPVIDGGLVGAQQRVAAWPAGEGEADGGGGVADRAADGREEERTLGGEAVEEALCRAVVLALLG